ncbi:MAG: cytochrome c [Deltaproteobacteria bacterium]|nr:cytochrome c [Deltaproteobacteria bacterium]MCB9788944.1 cytochrome c [Deltaproteobacteria bacterium]
MRPSPKRPFGSDERAPSPRRPPSPRLQALVSVLLPLAALCACDGGTTEHSPPPAECPSGTAPGPGGACTAVQPPARCDDGLDADADGVCDRTLADWSREARLPASGSRKDIYGQGADLPQVASRGLRHTLQWPVDVTGILLPWRPLAAVMTPGTQDPDVLTVQNFMRKALGFGTIDEMNDWLGLARADGADEALPGISWPDDVEAGDFLGASTLSTPRGDALTFSCATCHTAELFGRTVVGLTNRRAKANEFFHLAASFFPSLTSEFFQEVTGANADEVSLFEETQASYAAVGSVEPQVVGLDTSLAQVALSLARRRADAYATRDTEFEEDPRPNLLDDMVADSKPAVWWSLKYKTRWLADGSIVSGNPIYTNFLWNELGRGTDLHRLEEWLATHQQTVDELTVAAFATEPPRWVDFFGTEGLDLAAATRGKALFEGTCAECHGHYDKAWEGAGGAELPLADAVRTTRVRYHEQTPVLDVGTDPQRAQGTAGFAEGLNRLAISAWMGTVVEVQEGYVPPPLEGIWARYPYLHNQSVPSLCEMLMPASARTEVFYMGPDRDPETDYDADCVGLPVGDAIPASWAEDPHARFDTTRPGLSNGGHDAWLTDEDGAPRFDAAQRADLIAFLKTL